MALPDDVQKDVLRQVLRFCAIAENPSPNPVHQTDVTAEKHPECFPIGPCKYWPARSRPTTRRDTLSQHLLWRKWSRPPLKPEAKEPGSGGRLHSLFALPQESFAAHGQGAYKPEDISISLYYSRTIDTRVQFLVDSINGPFPPTFYREHHGIFCTFRTKAALYQESQGTQTTGIGRQDRQ